MADGAREAILSALVNRNRAGAAACSAARSCEELLAECAELEADRARALTRADLTERERQEMAADLALLRANEANAGVSREHIELLQQQLEVARSEASRASQDAAAARTKEEATAGAARDVADKLAAAQTQAAEQQLALEGATAREAALRTENARLLERLVRQLDVQAQAMDSEVEQHERRRLSHEAAPPPAEPVVDAGGVPVQLRL